MIDPSAKSISISKQCQLLNISRSSFYHRPKPISEYDLKLMRLIDELHLDHPCRGSRSMRNQLRRLGYKVNRKKVQRLMRLMGIRAVYPKPRTTIPHPQHKVYPYFLRNLNIDHFNQVWASDITYIPMRSGFMYLTVIMDWYSRKVLSWRISNSMDTDFCIDALEEALNRYGVPEIFNTDQGSQFTSKKFTDVLESHGVTISMDGRGRAQDNIFIERLWWSLKHQYLYLHAFESGSYLYRGLRTWFKFYNQERSHQALDNLTPDEVYYGSPSEMMREAA
jgi:putative transposase